MDYELKSMIPYKGDKQYIFISYCHKNSVEALEIVGHLQDDGYRVWYDEGIDPGTEWDENIALHVENCAYFIALLSADYLVSSNCKDELNYARELELPRLLIYLEDIRLPGGMQMRLSRLQAIHKYKYKEDFSFYEKLYEASDIDICRYDFSEQESQKKSEAKSRVKYILVNKADGKSYLLNEDSYLIGRNEKKCSIVLQDQLSSSLHAVLTIVSHGIYIKDLNSKNGTLVDGKLLNLGENRKLSVHSVIKIGNTEFIVRKEEYSDESEIARYKENVVSENSTAEEYDDCYLDQDDVINGSKNLSRAAVEECVGDNNEKEADPFNLGKEIIMANWTKANTMSLIIVFIIFSISALLGVVDENRCGVIIALLPVDVVCAVIVLFLPISFLAIEKWNLNQVLVAIYHALLFMGILFLHEFFVVTAFFKWYGVFLLVEVICFLSFGFPKYAKTTFLSSFSGALILALFTVVIQRVNRSTNILYSTSLNVMLISTLMVAVVANIIRLWLKKRDKVEEKE